MADRCRAVELDALSNRVLGARALHGLGLRPFGAAFALLLLRPLGRGVIFVGKAVDAV
jgi:hypothetical protein